jgi:hypothetical protein
MRIPPVIEPMPPRTPGRLPWLGSGLDLLRDPGGFFADARSELGDTFVCDVFGQRLFCVFSAEGVRALYALPEPHSCPAQRFSISAIRVAVRRLLDRYELEPEFESAVPRRRQLGGVARAERPCWVRYRAS